MNTYQLTESQLKKALLDAFIHGTEVEAGETNKTFEAWQGEKLMELEAKKEDIQPVPLIEYLMKEFSEGKTEFRITTQWADARHWYIHPIGKRGSTLDIYTETHKKVCKEELSPSKETQKQSLVDLMEADQRDGIYGVRDNALWYNGKYRRLASELFSMAADEFSNHGCNDLDPKLLEGWTEPERLQLAIDFENYNVGHLEEFDPNHIFFQDYALMGFFAHLLNSEQEDKRSVATIPNSSNSADPQNTTK